MSIKTLVINPGSTSTKVGVFEDETLLFEETLRHPTEEIAKYASVIDQKDFRKEIILDFLKEKNCDPKSLNVIVGRGGLLKPIPGGTYAVSDALLADLKAGVQGQHASNLGGILAREIGDAQLHRGPRGGGRTDPEGPHFRHAGAAPPLHLPRPEPEGCGPSLCQGARHAV